MRPDAERRPREAAAQAQSPSAKRSIKTHAHPSTAERPGEHPDAEQLEELRARRLLELAGAYVRQALALPEQVETLQAITANLLFENAALRWQLDRLAGRVDALEREAGVSR